MLAARHDLSSNDLFGVQGVGGVESSVKDSARGEG